MKYIIALLILFCNNRDYFFTLTNGQEKIWWLNNRFQQGWLFRADSTFSYVRRNKQKQVEIIQWVEPDISYGDGIFKWQLAEDTLCFVNLYCYKIIRVTTDSLYLLDPDKAYGRDTILLVNHPDIRMTKQ